MFKNLWSTVTGGANKIAGRTDLAEAALAGSALVVYADDKAEDDELSSAMRSVLACKVLADNFTSTQLEQTFEKMLKRAEGGRVGRMGLLTEIGEVASNQEDAEVVLLTALEVADAGGIGDKEKVVLEKIAAKLNLKLANYL